MIDEDRLGRRELNELDGRMFAFYERQFDAVPFIYAVMAVVISVREADVIRGRCFDRAFVR